MLSLWDWVCPTVLVSLFSFLPSSFAHKKEEESWQKPTRESVGFSCLSFVLASCYNTCQMSAAKLLMKMELPTQHKFWESYFSSAILYSSFHVIGRVARPCLSEIRRDLQIIISASSRLWKNSPYVPHLPKWRVHWWKCWFFSLWGLEKTTPAKLLLTLICDQVLWRKSI